MLVFIPNTTGTDAIYRDHENPGASDDDNDDDDEDDDDGDTDELLDKDVRKLRVSDSQYFAIHRERGRRRR